MLVQELQVLKKSNTDARQALETHLRDAGITKQALQVDPEAAEALAELHKKVHEEWSRLNNEGPRLQKSNEDMSEDITRRRQEIHDEELEVSSLESEMRSKQEHLSSLEDRQGELDQESNRLSVSRATLTGQLQETEQIMERLRAEGEALRSELINLEMSKQFYVNKASKKSRSSKKKNQK